MSSVSRTEPFFAAIQAGDLDPLTALVASEPELLDTSHSSGLSPLMMATYYRQPAVVDLLLGLGAEPDLFSAAALGQTERLVALLAAEPALVSARSSDGWTALHLAAHFGQSAAVELLLARGAEVDARSSNPMANTALHAAAAGRHTAVVQLLLEHGAAVDARQHGGFTALHAAAQQGDLSLAALLLGHGADPSLPHDGGQTPLAMALERDHHAVADLLRPHGARE
jgi:ankyrin repeat protein